MKEQIQQYIIQHQLLSGEKPVVVGISGGADSVALLHILVSLGYKCIAAHCNFNLRGDESFRDEQFTIDFTKRLQVPLCKISFETNKYAQENRLSVEMAARELRYRWFEELLNTYDADAVAVAHHRDDSVETLLINLTRGSGLTGLTGIKPKNGNVVRPLLCVSREDIYAYIENNGLEYVTDSSNSSDIYTRNFIRLKVIPLLEEINPSVKASLARTANHLYDASLIYNHSIEEARRVIIQNNRLSISALLSFPAPATILYEMLKPYGFSRTVCESIFTVLDKDSGKIFYSSTHRLLKDRSDLLIDVLSGEDNRAYLINLEDDNVDLPVELKPEIVVIKESYQIEKDKKFAYFDFDKLSFPLVLRHWQEGDWFVPFGMKGKKKISDYFSDKKFSLFDKEKTWLLCSGQDVIWIVGERTDNRYRIEKTTKRVLKLKFID
ncbi:tRNA lysidine(34) synthetase TilS [Macellibacteroides fermentans]|uniref:tRNA lysidine(34) synthetase TilS n=1 Tax=Macellibacteroides fermentans TaxID=879969 RepID=UPI002890CE21|nr:tRNA lysidine(34) synthetase TilS [Bacteroidota bacterium]